MPPLRDRLDDELIRHVLRAALDAGADFAELYAEERRGRSLKLEDRRVEELTSGLDRGAGIRVVTGDQAAYAYTNLLDRDSLVEAARIAAAGAAGDASREVADLTVPERRVDHPVKKNPFEADKQSLVDLAVRADEAARTVSGDVSQVVVIYLDVEQDLIVANSDGRLSDDHRVRTRMVAQVVAARDGLIQTGFEGPGASLGHELFDQHSPEEIGRTAANRAVVMLDSKPAPTGEMPVVLWRGDGGVLFHEACGHGMEGDLISKKASVYVDKQGQQIASELLSAVDDATVQNGWGSFAFDDEGTPAQRTVMFDKGVLTDYLSDRRSARNLSISGSGNGRRQSYAHVPVPRMTNTHVLPGSSTPDEAIESLDRGILVKGLGGGQVNTATGDFVFGMAEAYLVEGGEISHPVRGANLVGNGPDALRDIDMVCNDFAVKQGTCGKDGQSVPVGMGTPTMRISRITIGGTG